MATLKQGIYTFLHANAEITALVGNKIFSKRVMKSKVEAPYIVYSVDGYENKLGQYQGQHGYKGQKVVIDVVGPYEMEDTLEAVSNTVGKILGGANGDIGGRKGTGSIVYVDSGYEEKTDFSVFRTGFLFKEIF